ncbi:SGNH/GDSL hydrolase family protein [Neorhodopirellula pilleata]|uniref:GDSL-like Lipase/Acylhydrolase n=1 Tax=Neorhodopirellula pilleata TaxID=2714738 RepID=A0A5C6AS38_9BACT|nr:SGNH/GDSL hydrolase family protein [Neorhodopirellula pilleata]TWU02079.1 hypothetical protein Pla100_18190 [Neorhodopirellula pilleata]
MPAQITSRRRWIFRLTAIAIGFLPLVVVEIGLRWIDGREDSRPSDGFDGTGLFTPVQADQPSGTVTWEISPRRSNYFCHASFVAPKPPNTRRVFVLGGSTVQGRPYASETAFAKFLELRLNSADTDRRHEVINCGGVSYASDRVERILHEVLGHQPDAIVLYIGHNEFLEDRLEDRHGQQHASSAQRWINWAAGKSRAVGVLREVWTGTDLAGSSNRSTDPEGTFFDLQTRLDREGGMRAFRRDSSWRNQVERQFEQTLDRMVRTCRKQRIPLIVCVPASDVVRTPPFKVEPNPSALPSQDAFMREAWQTIVDAETDQTERFRLARNLLEIDSEHAGAHFVLGRAAYDRDPTPESCSDAARKHLIAARDFDVCPLRATTTIEETVRSIGQVASKTSPVQLVDIPRLFDRPPLMRSAIEDDIADPGWFVDHVHPTISGHRRIATELSRTFETWGWFERSNVTEDRYQEVAREHLSTLGEEYYQRGKQRLEGLQRWAAGRSGQTTIEQ